MVDNIEFEWTERKTKPYKQEMLRYAIYPKGIMT